MIPKILHRIWVGGPLPAQYVKFAEEWARLLPDWELRLWSEPDLQWLENQHLFDNAEEYVAADAVGQFRSDVARYEILRKHGGVYVDCDVEPLRSLNPLLTDGAFAGWEEPGEFVGNTVLGSVPGHPVWDAMVRRVEGSAKANRGRAATWISGPRVFTPVARAAENFVIHPQGYFFPYSYKDLKRGPDPAGRSFPDAYVVHHWGHQRELRNRPLVRAGDGRLSVAIMAHKKRERWVEEYLVPRLPGARVVWDRLNDRWDTGARSLLSHDDSQWHLVVQDDALLPEDFLPGVDKMLRHVPPDSPAGLYYGRVRPRELETRRLIAEAQRKQAPFIVHNGPWWGVGIVIPSVHASPIVEYGDRQTHVPNYDRRIARFYQSEGIDCYYPQPSLIEHRHGGENPSLVPGRTAMNRRAYRFVGPQSALEVDWSGPVVRSRQ